MKYTNSFKQLVTFVAIIAMLSLSNIRGSVVFDHRVEVRNSSNRKITKILASADGEKYVGINVGSGLKPEQTMEVDWDRSQGHECVWYLKAVYADTSESAPAQFDLCEKDVMVEFK